jgi:hypothetical protein
LKRHFIPLKTARNQEIASGGGGAGPRAGGVRVGDWKNGEAAPGEDGSESGSESESRLTAGKRQRQRQRPLLRRGKDEEE